MTSILRALTVLMLHVWSLCVLWSTPLLFLCTGWIPETLEEWKLLLHLLQNKNTRPAPQESLNGSLSDGPAPINVENVALLLAKAMGPDRAWSLLQECGLALELSEKFTRTCDILRIAERRQR